MEVCEGTALNLNAYIPGYTNYAWSNGDTNSFTQVNDQTELIIQAGNNICIVQDTIKIAFIPLPFAYLPSDTSHCFKKGKLELFAPVGFKESIWNPGGVKSEVLTINDAGNYELVLTSNEGCIKTLYSKVKENCTSYFWAPNAFTPNDDGLNDTFKIFGPEPLKSSLEIYNSWNQLLFSTNNFNLGWDGKINITQVQGGVFIYIFKYTLPGQPERVIKGNFTLLR